MWKSIHIIKKFSKTFLDVTVKDLQTVDGIGPAKALQITAAISLVKRFYEDSQSSKITIKKVIQLEDETIQKGDIIASKDFPKVEKNKR